MRGQIAVEMCRTGATFARKKKDRRPSGGFGIRGWTASMCSQEEVVTLLLASLFRSMVCSHSILCTRRRRFLRPLAFFPLGIADAQLKMQKKTLL